MGIIDILSSTLGGGSTSNGLMNQLGSMFGGTTTNNPMQGYQNTNYNGYPQNPANNFNNGYPQNQVPNTNSSSSGWGTALNIGKQVLGGLTQSQRTSVHQMTQQSGSGNMIGSLISMFLK